MTELKHREIEIKTVLEQYKQYYKSINGGIDGYYEKVILNAKVYQMYSETVVGCFTVHETRGLTSFVVFPEYQDNYEEIFNYVIKLPFIDKMLFSEKDKQLLKCVVNRKLSYEIQAFNFIVEDLIATKFQMIPVTLKDHQRIKDVFGDFIKYNSINLSDVKSFIYLINDEIVSFGALENLILDTNRHCISMIVNEKYRKKSYGTKTIKFLIQYLQDQNFEVNARCYVENVASLKTLLKSGMILSNHLYKVEKLK